MNFRDKRINIKNSIDQGRIVYTSKWFHLFLDKLLFLIIFLVTVIGYISVISIENPYYPTDGAWQYYFPLIIVSGLMTISGFQTDKLKRIRGVKRDVNKKIIKEVIDELKWSIESSIQDVTFAIPSSDYLFNGGRQVTIIYDQNDILINSTAYSFLGGVSPVHIISNQSIIRQLRKGIEKKRKNNVA